MTADHVELGGEIPGSVPEACYVEVTTNAGLVLKYRFRYDAVTGTATIDMLPASEIAPAFESDRSKSRLKDCSR